jgi:two-component system, sensor histidine kinase LadS
MNNTPPLRTSWRHCWRLLVLAPLLLLLAQVALAQPPGPAELAAAQIRIWADPSGQAPVEEARRAFERGEGRAANAREVMPFGGGRAVWYRVALPTVSAPTPSVLTVPLASIDSVELYRPAGDGQWQLERAGDLFPVADWPMRYLHPRSPCSPARGRQSPMCACDTAIP